MRAALSANGHVAAPEARVGLVRRARMYDEFVMGVAACIAKTDLGPLKAVSDHALAPRRRRGHRNRPDDR